LRDPALMASTQHNTAIADTRLHCRMGDAMDTRNPPDIEVVKDAERILYREKWRICEELAAQRLSQTSSFASTRLFPESPVIHVVAVDGVVVGQARRNGSRWIAIRTGRPRTVSDCGSLHAAIHALTAEDRPW
jgi:hypothetical protein